MIGNLSYSEVLKSSKNWKEDFVYENGNYMNTCLACDSQFLGYKRRMLCKECAKPNNESKPDVNVTT